ncbi:copper-binding protein [Paraburkholderia aromaticivorans]|uniref:RND transporter n=1 Tax=Paraburkholderia aromaticivorans TaxID=2026199 RepID=A0A248VUP8_9BURK|nr:copper-binding protein [Paraburkholderia aromaticivorans]ASW02697.1 RND transporter [Paraburkholderia aromaticivorans]
MKNVLVSMVMVCTATVCASAYAADPASRAAAGTEGAQAGSEAGGEAKAGMSHGEVRKVDSAAGKLTIKHGPLENLGMEAMTMVFKVKDPAMLSQVKPGDRIDFIAEEVDGALTVVKLEKR